MRSRFGWAMVVLVLSAGCFGPAEGRISEVSPQEVVGLLRNDFAVVVDVREVGDSSPASIPASARKIPLARLEAGGTEAQDFIRNLPQSKQVVLVAGSQEAGARGAKLLSGKGFNVGIWRR